DRDRPGPHRLGRHTQPRHTTSSTTRTRNPTPVTQRRDTMIDLRPRHMVFVAASAVTLMTAACGGTTIDDADEEDTGGPTGTADPDAEIPEDLAIDFLPKQLNNPFFDLVNDGGQEAVEELGGQATERGGTEATADSQVEYINAAGQAGSDVIVIAANDPDAV